MPTGRSMSTVAMPLVGITIHQEEIPLDTMSQVERVPDPEWRHIDKKGHLHAWVDGELPSLEWVVTGKEWAGDEYGGEEFDVGEHRCAICAMKVKPGYKTTYGGRRSIPGPRTYMVTINDQEYPLNPDQYAESVDAWGAACRAILMRSDVHSL